MNHRVLGFFLLFLIPAFFYFTHISVDVYGVDVGDFTTTAYLWGIAHPPGYPLFVAFSGILMRILSFVDPIEVLGSVSALSSLLTLLILFRFVVDLIKSRVIAVLSVASLAFSYLFWLYSVVGEAFALNNLILISLLYVSYKFYRKKNIKYLYLTLFLLGIGVSHHHTFALLLPSVALLLFQGFKKKRKIKTYFKATGFFFLGLLPYAYVIIASYHAPLINWMGKTSFENFFDLITRRAYGTFQATVFHINSTDELFVVFKTYVVSITNSLSLPVILIAFLGFIKLYKTNKRYFSAFLAAFLITGPFFNTFAGFPLYNYFNIGVAERFYLFSTVILVIPFAYGLLGILKVLQMVLSKKVYASLILYAFFLIPVFLFIKNNPKTDFSKLTVGNDYAHDLLSSAPKNSIVFLTGDTALFNTWYIHYVKGERKDVVLARPYDNFIMNTLRSEEDVYFKNNNNKTRVDFIKYLSSKKPVLSVDAVNLGSQSAYMWVPQGLLHRLYKKNEVPTHSSYLNLTKSIWDSFNLRSIDNLAPAERNYVSVFTVGRYPQALTETAWFFYHQYDDDNSAKKYLNQAISLDPTYAKAYATLGVIIHDSEKNCSDSLKLLRKAILLNPLGTNNFVLLDKLALECKAEKFDDSTTQEFLKIFDVNPSSIKYEQ